MKCCWKPPPESSPVSDNMSLQTQHRPSPASGEPLSVPAAVLDNLAARFRTSGLFVVLLHTDGSIIYHDPQAALFFQRYVLPLLQYGDPTEPDLQAKLGKITVNSPVMIWNNLPGIILATVPCVQRRQLWGVLALAGR